MEITHLFLDYNSNRPITYYFDSYDDALKYAINYYMHFFKHKNIFNLLSINDIIKHLNKHDLYIFNVREPIKSNYKFDFELINYIKEYSLIDNYLISDFGFYKLSDEELEKFKCLILFK